jgi:isopentenyl phosphate kinase
LHGMFTSIDTATGAVRLYPEEITYLSPDTQGSFVLGWDIRPNLTISSWDTQFPEIINATQATEGYMLTNVGWVLDKNNQIIPVITKNILSSIAFREVDNDVTWGMKWKIEELFDRILMPCTIRIIEGNDLDNVSAIMRTGTWVWTKIIIE